MPHVQIYQGQPTAAGGTVYTAEATTVIQAAVVSNPTGSARALSVSIVPDGGSAGDGTKLIHSKNILSGDDVGLGVLVSQVIEKGATLHMTAGADTSLTVTLSGVTT